MACSAKSHVWCRLIPIGRGARPFWPRSATAPGGAGSRVSLLNFTQWQTFTSLKTCNFHACRRTISRDIVSFPSELCRRRSGMFSEVARLVLPDTHGAGRTAILAPKCDRAGRSRLSCATAQTVAYIPNIYDYDLLKVAIWPCDNMGSRCSLLGSKWKCT